MQIMAASKNYSDEFRGHALRMVGEIHDEGVDQSDDATAIDETDPYEAAV
jgi:hypothetical protein